MVQARLLGKRRGDLRARRSPRSVLVTLKVLATTTARFALVVEACGKPRAYTLWQEPKKDRHLRSQIRQHHIMTIERTESGSEFGVVGFLERRHALYLEFPKSLKQFADQRIVGIKWELVKN